MIKIIKLNNYPQLAIWWLPRQLGWTHVIMKVISDYYDYNTNVIDYDYIASESYDYDYDYLIIWDHVIDYNRLRLQLVS